MPDGNRRFARKEGIPFSEAYHAGARTLRLFSDFFVAEGRSEQFVFHVMSDYTHKRTDLTLGPIYDAIRECFGELQEDRFFENRAIKFRAIDHSGKIPLELRGACERLERASLNGASGEVVVLLGYSLEKDYNDALAGGPKNYEELRGQLLFPDIDLVIRPKEMRPSSGPVYAMGQSQIVVLDKLNPEVERADLLRVLEEYDRWKSYKEENNPAHRI